MPIEQFFGAWMIDVLGARRTPALPDLVPCALENIIVCGVLPLDKVLDDLEKPLTFVLLRVLRLENVRMR